MKTRPEILAVLAERSWYAETEAAVKELIQSLPDDCNGMLEQIADRPEEGGGVRLIRLKQLLIPNYPGGKIFGATVSFDVEKIDASKAQFNYQYHIWKQGPASGTKGVALIAKKRKDNKPATAADITHVVHMKGFSFAVGAFVDDCIGGFADQPGLKLGPQFLKELEKELGVSGDSVSETITLGDFYPDRGQTANRPSLAAVVIDADVTLNAKHDNPDPFEMRSGGVVVPVAALWGADGAIMKNMDGYFAACLLRLLALGRIPGPA
jgi:hypothetical protein